MADENRTQQVSLGCGTLILIALIVLIFSGRGNDEIEREVQGLRTEVSDLRKSIDAQTSEIKRLRQKLDQPPVGAKAAPGQ
jgi:hypothetical protein